ncbi:TPA: hypothetical protein NV435_002631 [Enterobacter hormaechei subsp. xiangfangensis]|nr:hypothetical protein [Enterobacter hormaechei subsp. xiangfangensis]
MTKTEFENETWRLKGLLLEALIRRLEEDKAGEGRMAAAELSSAVNFLKANAVEAPVTSFNRVFEDDEQ